MPKDVAATVVRFRFLINGEIANVDVRMFDAVTPLHVQNIVDYIDADLYDGTVVHRNAKTQLEEDFVVQGGGYKILTSILDPNGMGWESITRLGTVQNEPGISNLRGTIALAKGQGISSGTSEWFFNLSDDNSFLDLPERNEFTVFGRVINDGMSVIDAIAALETVNAGSPFSEVPVFDFDKVIDQQDVFNADVPILQNIVVRNRPDGDYNFNAIVNQFDLEVWEADFGSTLNVEADGNGSATVDGADFLIWQRDFGIGLPATAASTVVPEPASALLAVSAAAALLAASRRRLSSSRSH
ncbi:MAG: peptidylprolyl isomerase [Planctomycetota bacterium]